MFVFVNVFVCRSIRSPLVNRELYPNVENQGSTVRRHWVDHGFHTQERACKGVCTSPYTDVNDLSQCFVVLLVINTYCKCVCGQSVVGVIIKADGTRVMPRATPN